MPTVKRGRSLTFVNRDDIGADLDIFRTVTSCEPPCSRTTGVAYPLADGRAVFDSGELGTGPAGFTAASNRLSWKDPEAPQARHLHVFLPGPPVHAGSVPRQGVGRCAGRAGSPRA